MSEQVVEKPKTKTVTFEEYLEQYAGDFYELVEGQLIKMAPASYQHNAVIFHLHLLLKTYFTLNPIGEVINAPFTMRITTDTGREPDLLVVLKTNPKQRKATYMDGPADICIEVVSPESVKRDHGEKFEEYEKAGVKEYWIFDPLRNETRLYRRNEEGRFMPQYPDEKGIYRTPLLPKFELEIAILWKETLPDPIKVVEMVRKMMGED